MTDYSGMKRRNGMTQDNGTMRAVDVMAAGGDANADRKKKGAEYGMGSGNVGVDLSKSKTKTPGEAYDMAKKALLGLKRRVLGD